MTEIHKLITEAFEQKFNTENIEAEVEAEGNNSFRLRLTCIFGQKVNWELSSVRYVDFYKYFEKQLLDEIAGVVFDETSTKMDVLFATNWIPDFLKDEIENDFKDVLVQLNISINYFWIVFEEMARNGYMSKAIYLNIIEEYTKSVTKRYINLTINKIDFMVSQTGYYKIKIVFNSGHVLFVTVQDLFMGSHFCDPGMGGEYSNDLLSTIKRTFIEGLLLCKQKCFSDG